jgi:hypothetical protein
MSGPVRHQGIDVDPNAQRIINDAIDDGAKVEFYASPNACLACRALLAKVFEPADAPIIPLPECQSPPCRCDYLPAYPGRRPRF